MLKIFALVLLFLTSACAWTEESVFISRPSVSVSPVPGASLVSVTVVGNDVRVEREVSHKKNGYGMRGSNINVSNNISEEVRSGISEILISQGFQSGSDINLRLDLNRFYSMFDIGFWSATANAQAIATLTAATMDGRVIYTRSYTATHQEGGVQLMTGDNAALALRGALGVLMRQIADDAQLTRSLLDAAVSNRPDILPPRSTRFRTGS